MSKIDPFISKPYSFLLSEKAKAKGERSILIIALASFLIHLALIVMVDLGWILKEFSYDLLSNPISAIYTPFSFIIVYEVYLLLYYLPQSITTYISKQYEIIALILIRKTFKDLANLDLESNWFQNQEDLQFTYDIVAAIVIFFLIFLFYYNTQKSSVEKKELSTRLQKFVSYKKAIALVLVPIIIGLALYTVGSWLWVLTSGNEVSGISKDINRIFFEDFFGVMIFVDVVLLLLSLFYTDKFHKVIRNSGFVISTILIRLSFSVEGLVKNVLIISAVTLGLLTLLIHNLFEKRLPKSHKSI